jgi:O-antigen chain-terminating methyltransferase
LAGAERINKQLDRLHQLKKSQSDTFAELAATIDQVGECPPGPPTLRARLGRLVIGFLNRLLWWKTMENRRLSALMLEISRRQAGQLEILASALEERARVAGSTGEPLTLASLRSQMTAHQADLDRRVREVEAVLLDLQSLRTAMASSLDGGAGFTATREEVFRRIEVIEQLVHRIDLESSARQAKLTGLLARADQAFLRLDSVEERVARLSEIHQELSGSYARLTAQLRVEEDKVAAIGRRLADLGLQNQRLRTDVSLQDRRLSVFLAEARKRLPKPLDREQIGALVSREAEILDSLYLAFEDIYRGSRGEIKERQSVYLPLLRSAGIGTASMPILDLGCGRGEWLELLAGEGWHASGVDANRLMLEECRGHGLRVERGDVLNYLQGVPEATLGAVTSFHVVEHLPFDRVMLLIDEALRVLRPGGILILETPNPDNLLVGASTFYLDPTHVRPIPNGTLRFVAEARGFCNVEIWNLHPMPETARLPEDPSGVAGRLNELLCGPRDYAIIGRRP